MPSLFIPVFLFAGAWLAFGIASLSGEHKEQTYAQKCCGVWAIIAFIIAMGFGGALVASYVPAAVEVCR